MPSMLEPVDSGFLATAPTRFEETFAIARPAAAVWAELVSADPLAWCRALAIQWRSEPPFGVGTKRSARILGGIMRIEEHYFVWEEGRRKAFYATQCNLPVFRRLAEDYVVEPDGDGRCRLTWTIAMDPKGVGKAAGPVNGALVKSLFADTRKHFGVA